MKKLLLILLCLPMLVLAQQTYVPDDNFEAYLEANGMGNGIANDNHVTTANISTVLSLDVSSQNISDLTGIEDFISLTDISCYNNTISSLDLSNNQHLIYIHCSNNNLTSLDLSDNLNLQTIYCSENYLTSIVLSSNLTLYHFSCDNNNLTSLDLSTISILLTLDCSYNQLTTLDVSQTGLTGLLCTNNLLDSLDVSQNYNLVGLYCSNNNLTELDVSNNTFLTILFCDHNQLTKLDMSNGNAQNISHDGWSYQFDPRTNPLSCISVTSSDLNWVNTNLSSSVYISNSMYFSDSCIISPPPVNIQEEISSKEKIKIVDLLGRETKGKKNQPLLYLYDNGTVEKRITID